jgi:hypothetical protein
MNKLAFMILILILMAISNPKLDEHRSVVKQSIVTNMTSTIKEPQGFGESIGVGLGMMIGSSAIELLINTATYHNFILFSILSIKKKNDQELLSIGVFGNVFALIEE